MIVNSAWVFHLAGGTTHRSRCASVKPIVLWLHGIGELPIYWHPEVEGCEGCGPFNSLVTN